MTCGAEGSRSLLALAHADVVMSGSGPEPVMCHLTSCEKHVQGVRQWLRSRSEDGQVQTVRTERLMERWGQIVTPLELGVWTSVSTAGAAG